MSVPITTVTSETYNTIVGAGSFYRKQIKRSQVKPINQPLPYYLKRVLIFQASSQGDMYPLGSESMALAVKPWWTAVSYDFPYYSINEYNTAISKAIAKFTATMGTQTQLALNWIERKQTVLLFEESINKLLDFTNNVRRRNFYGAVKALGLSPRKLRRDGITGLAKSMGDNWLKFHFGVMPIVNDIYDSAKILSEDFPTPTIEARAGVDLSRRHYQYLPNPTGQEVFTGSLKCRLSVGIGAKLTAVNPNLHLIDRVGLGNPVALLYDATPFSFVVDWFSNVGQYIAQWTDFAAASLSDQYHTIYLTASVGSVITGYYIDYRGVHWGVRQIASGGVLLERKLGHPGIPLVFKPVYRMSLTRGSTAIALLLQGIKN